MMDNMWDVMMVDQKAGTMDAYWVDWMVFELVDYLVDEMVEPTDGLWAALMGDTKVAS